MIVKAGRRSLFFSGVIATLLTGSFALPAFAAPPNQLYTRTSVKDRVNGAVGFLAYSVLPDTTLSTIQISNSGSDETDVYLSQLGGAFTWSGSFPLYLEGYLGIARYDPRFIMSDGLVEREVPIKWNSISATLGMGWDFKISEHWVLRPILNLSAGHMESDTSLAGRFVNYKTDAGIDFLENGRLNAAGLGGSLMLDYEIHKPEYEADVELRYTQINLQTVGGTSAGVKGSSIAQSFNVWARLRVPTGLIVFRKPLRYVFEISQSDVLGEDAEALGFNHLTKLGTGIEFDLSDTNDLVSRLRIVGRYLTGPGVSGYSVGFAVSF